MLIAFIISPWAAYRLLKGASPGHGAPGGASRGGGGLDHAPLSPLMVPLIRDARRRTLFLAGVVVLLLASMALVPLKAVTVKMLPFDNKSEFQVIVDTPEGTTLEQTTAVARAVGEYVRQAPEATDYQVYAGTAGPYNFNGLVRHYFLRQPGVRHSEDERGHPGAPDPGGL